MEPLGFAIQSNVITWNPDQASIATLAANKSLHLTVWKAIAPLPGTYT
jgi:hypothetical protein